jgi:hypothetical protein
MLIDQAQLKLQQPLEDDGHKSTASSVKKQHVSVREVVSSYSNMAH